MKHRIWAFVGLLGLGAILTASTANLREFSLQQALNILAGNSRAPYTAYSAQQAANVLVNRQIAEQDSMIATFVIVLDDNLDDAWGDSLRAYPGASLIKKTTRAIFKQYGMVAGLSLEPHDILYGDTTAILTPAKVRGLINTYGFEGGTVGYNEPSSLYSADKGMLARGNYTKGMALFEYDIRRGYEACRDSLGVVPRWISWSNSTSAQVLKRFAQRYYEFGFQSAQTASVSSSDGIRPNGLYSYDVAAWGAWGAGGSGFGVGAGNRNISAAPGVLPDRYEILQSLGESASNGDSAITYQTIRRAMQTRGMVVWIGHSFTTWEGNLSAGTNDVAKLFSYLKTMQDAGRLRVVLPSTACDLYFNAPISPAANYSTNNFQDYDKDNNADWWFEGRGNSYANSDTAFLKPTTGSIGHGGTTAMGMNWAGFGWNGSEIASQAWDGQDTADNLAFEGTNAVLASIPPAGGGWTVQFECWVIVDTTVTGWVAGTAPQAGDSIGVTFGGPSEAHANRFYLADKPDLIWGGSLFAAVGTKYTAASNTDLYAGTTFPPFFKLNEWNNRHRGASSGTNKHYGKWAHIIASWDVPEFSDYVFISVWKSGTPTVQNIAHGTPANGILISDYSVTYHRRFQMSNSASLTRL